MSRSNKLTEPPSGRSSPVIRLKRVVLPAPLGPMIRRRSPASTARSTPDVTRSPPNDFVRLRTASALTVGLLQRRSSYRRSDDVAGSQLGNLRLLVAQLGQDLVGVLAQRGSPPLESPGSLRQIDRRRRERHAAGHTRVLRVPQQTGRADVRVVQRLLL